MTEQRGTVKTNPFTHAQQQQWQRQHQTEPEATCHVIEFSGVLFHGGVHGLECHAADRAAAGADLLDFRVHRAGIDRICRAGGLVFSVRRQIAHRIGFEFGHAAGAAEIISLAVMHSGLVRVGRRFHAADRIGVGLFFRSCCRDRRDTPTLDFANAGLGYAFLRAMQIGGFHLQSLLSEVRLSHSPMAECW